MEIGFIGCGNMSQALIKGLLLSKIKPKNITASNRTLEKLTNFQKETNINIALSNIGCIKNKDIVFIGVKPKDVEDLLQEIKNDLDEKTIIVSMVASISTDFFKKYLHNDIVRIIPNTACLINKGVIAVNCQNKNIENKIIELLNDLGLIIAIEENLFSGFIGISGSAIAYVYAFIEALAKAGVSEGFSYEEALKIADMTVIGGSLMVEQTKTAPNILISNVCSEGGTTIEGINSLKNNHFNDIIKDAVMKASLKDKEKLK